MARGEGSHGRKRSFLLLLFIRDCGSSGTDIGIFRTQGKQATKEAVVDTGEWLLVRMA